MRIIFAGIHGWTKAFLQLVQERREALYTEHGFAPTVVGVIDGERAVVTEPGFDTGELISVAERMMTRGGGFEELADKNHGLIDAAQAIQEAPADVLIDTSWTSLADAQRGVQRLKLAFRSGLHVVSVNMMPLARALPALLELAEYNRVVFRFSGGVAGGTPIIEFAEACARGDEITHFNAVFGVPTDFILRPMHESSVGFATARARLAPDEYLDAGVDGIITAINLVVFSNVILRRPITIDDVDIAGLRIVDRDRIEEAREAGKCVRLVGEIRDTPMVAPKDVELGSPLDTRWEHSAAIVGLRHAGDMTISGHHGGGYGWATAILRDVLEIWHEIGSRS